MAPTPQRKPGDAHVPSPASMRPAASASTSETINVNSRGRKRGKTMKHSSERPTLTPGLAAAIKNELSTESSLLVNYIPINQLRKQTPVPTVTENVENSIPMHTSSPLTSPNSSLYHSSTPCSSPIGPTPESSMEHDTVIDPASVAASSDPSRMGTL